MANNTLTQWIKVTTALVISSLFVPSVNAADLASQRIDRELITQTLPLEGVIEATNRAIVSAQTGGRVLEMPFDVGDTVLEGNMIVSITSNEQRAGLEAALAQLSAARSQAAEAATQFTRISELYDKKMVSKTDYDRSKAQNDSAKAAVKAAEAGLSAAKQKLAYTEVYAPYSGVVVRRMVEVGEAVAPGSPLLEGLSLDNLRVRVDLPQLAADALRANGEATVILDNGQSIKPDNIRISPMANTISHTFNTLLYLPKELDASALPGSLVKVSIALSQRETLTAPASAIAKRGDINAVYVANNGTVNIRYVRLGRQLNDNKVEVVSGLKEGDLVVLDPIAAAAAYKQRAIEE